MSSRAKLDRSLERQLGQVHLRRCACWDPLVAGSPPDTRCLALRTHLRGVIMERERWWRSKQEEPAVAP